MVGIQIIVGFYGDLFFQVIPFLFKEIINLLPDGGRYFIAEKVDCFLPVLCQVIQGAVVCVSTLRRSDSVSSERISWSLK